MSKRVFLIYLAIAALFYLAFSLLIQAPFVSWDDDVNFLLNGQFRGLGWQNLVWAWTTPHLGVYQPIAWMLFEIQYAMGGLNAALYHITGILLYGVVTYLVFLVYRHLDWVIFSKGKKPQQVFPSAQLPYLIMLFFLLHPLRVEVVGWVSCQPYLCCAAFYFGAIYCYLRWRDQEHNRKWFWAALACYAGSVLSKAVGISLPLVLLALDYYPYQRFVLPKVIFEKWQFLLIALGTALLAIWSREQEHGIVGLEQVTVFGRMLASAYSICFYVVKTILPINLSNYYPMQIVLSVWDAKFGLSLLFVVSLFIYLFTKRQVAKGRFALGMAVFASLIPTLGIMRIGQVIAADRYSFFASLILAIGLGLAVDSFLRSGRLSFDQRKIATGIVGILVIAAAIMSRNQSKIWLDSGVLWENAVALAPENNLIMALPHNNLGYFEMQKGDLKYAEKELRRAIELNPNCGLCQANMGGLFITLGRTQDALPYFLEAIKAEPGAPGHLANYGSALGLIGRNQEAEEYFRKAVALAPTDAKITKGLAQAVAANGKKDEAENLYRKAIALDPGQASAYTELAILLNSEGRVADAEAEIKRGLSLNPDNADLHYNMGVFYYMHKANEQAIMEFNSTLRLNPNYEQAKGALKLLQGH